MNFLMILYFMLVSPPPEPIETAKDFPILTSNKIVKPVQKSIEESSVYYHAPTKWVKISKKI